MDCTLERSGRPKEALPWLKNLDRDEFRKKPVEEVIEISSQVDGSWMTLDVKWANALLGLLTGTGKGPTTELNWGLVTQQVVDVSWCLIKTSSTPFVSNKGFFPTEPNPWSSFGPVAHPSLDIGDATHIHTGTTIVTKLAHIF